MSVEEARLRALRSANAQRIAMAAVKRALRGSQLTPRELLGHWAVQRRAVWDVVGYVRVRPRRTPTGKPAHSVTMATRLTANLEISDALAIRDLTERQRKVLTYNWDRERRRVR